MKKIPLSNHFTQLTEALMKAVEIGDVEGGKRLWEKLLTDWRIECRRIIEEVIQTKDGR